MEYEKLPEDFKRRWCEALRSGAFKQGPGRLFDAKNCTHCCLGVACNVAGIKDPRDVENVYGHIAAVCVVPELQPLIDSSVSVLLADMNDNGKTFPEIADWIEANL